MANENFYPKKMHFFAVWFAESSNAETRVSAIRRVASKRQAKKST